MPRPNDKKKGIFSRFRRQSPEEAGRAKMAASAEALQAEREEVLDDRRDLKAKIDRHSDRARTKKGETDAAVGPKKKILDRELRSILRPLQSLIKQDNRLEVRLNQLDSLLDKAREASMVSASGITDEVIEDIMDATEEAIDREEERQDLVKELTGMNFETAQDEVSTDDMLADLGMDLGETQEQETAPQVQRAPQHEEKVRPVDTTERISEGKRELDRLMAELDEEDD